MDKAWIRRTKAPSIVPVHKGKGLSSRNEAPQEPPQFAQQLGMPLEKKLKKTFVVSVKKKG